MPDEIIVQRDEGLLEVEGGGDFPISPIAISGEMRVPADKYPITTEVTLRVAQAEPEGLGSRAKCMIAGLSDELGWFQAVEAVEAPTQHWALERFIVSVVPDFALLAARSGVVDCELTVRVMEGEDPHRLIGEGSTTFPMEQAEAGYLEWDTEQLDGDRHVATLAVAAAAIDGVVHQSEVDVIRRYFRTRYEGRRNLADLRARASLTLQQSLSRLENGVASPARLIEEASLALRHEFRLPVRSAAYALAIRVVAADRILAAPEKSLLEALASSLGLPDLEVAKVRDRLRAEAQFAATYQRR